MIDYGPLHARLRGLLPASAIGQLLLTCLVVAGLTTLARLPFVLSPGLSTDSYAYLQGWPTLEQLFSQGRFGQFLVFKLLGAFAIDPLAFATLLQGVGLAVFAFSTPLMFTAFADRRQRRLGATGLAALMVTLHPYSAEILTFSEASFTAQLACAMGVAAIFIVATRPRFWWLAWIMLVAALSMYQLLINIAALMILLGIIQTYLRAGGSLRGECVAYRPLFYAILVLGGALVAYLCIHKSLVTALGISEVGRAGFLPLDKLYLRAQEIVSLGGFLWQRTLLVAYGSAAKGLFWGMVASGWLLLLLRLLVRPRMGSVLPIIAMGLVPAAAMGVIAVGKVWWPAPRVLGGVVLACAMGIYWVGWFAQGRLGRALVLVLGGILLLSFTAVGHRVHSDQLQLNAFDRLLAQRIYDEMIRTPGYTDQMPVAVVNRRLNWAHSMPLATAWMDLNLTAFADKRALKGLLELSNGRTLNHVPAEPGDIEECAKHPAWPDPGFVLKRPEGGILVCI